MIYLLKIILIKFMKKKIKFFIVFLLITIFLWNSSFVFAKEMTLDEALKNFSWDVWKWFYKKIDSGIGVIEEKFYKKEFLWNKEKVQDILNQIAKDNKLAPCFTKEVSFEKIDKFVKKRQETLWLLKDFLDEKCITVLNSSVLEWYKNVILEAYEQMHKKAKEKVKRINQLIKAWVFSDWIKTNSNFDIISDIQDINDILFRKKLKYDWVFKEDLWDYDILIKELLKWKSTKEAIKEAQKWKNKIWDIKITDPVSNLRPAPIVDWNSLVCPPTQNTSWLDPKYLEKLEDSFKWENWKSNNQNNNWNEKNNNWDNKDKKEEERKDTNYKQKTDDNIWPCFSKDVDEDEFSFHSAFCIKFEKKYYTQNLLDYWEVRTIQWIVERSNEHLKKFTHVSLVPNKMSINNFEMWYVDLNLADLFHVNVAIRWEPVPILNLKKANNNKKDDDFSLENLLKRHFANLKMQYKRENDIELYLQRDYEIQNVNMAKDNKLTKLSSIIKQKNAEILEKQLYENKLFDREINMKANSWELREFYSIFAELASFSKRFKTYWEDLNILIKKMKEIPSI